MNCQMGVNSFYPGIKSDWLHDSFHFQMSYLSVHSDLVEYLGSPSLSSLTFWMKVDHHKVTDKNHLSVKISMKGFTSDCPSNFY